MNDITLFLLFIWVVSISIFLLYYRRKNVESVGLPLLYLFALAQKYGISPIIYLLSWYSSERELASWVGYFQSTYALVGYTVGVLCITPIIFDKRETPSISPIQTNIELPLLYIFFGATIIFVPMNQLIPKSMTGSIWHLVSVGIVMLVWLQLKEPNYNRLIILMLLPLPLITGFFTGFMGLGANIISIVIVFWYVVFRPPLKFLVSVFFIGYIGISVAISFNTIKQQVRDIEWNERSTNSRAELFENFITQFQWFDLRNTEHLAYIDQRLNQNYVTGIAINNMKANNIPFSNGTSIRLTFEGLVPRFLWPNKPTLTGGNKTVSYYTNLSFAEDTSVGLGHVLEFYTNFGTAGVLLGFLFLGIIIRHIDYIAVKNLKAGHLQQFAIWYAVGLSFMNIEDNIVVGTVSAIAAVLALSAIHATAIAFYPNLGARLILTIPDHSDQHPEKESFT